MALTVQGVAVHIVDEGAGTPTLLLHGNPDSSDVWAGVIARLGLHYRCLAPDLPGFGRSSFPENFDYSFEGLARFVDELVEEIDITQPLNLVVHDFGGAFGLAWAAKHPQKVRRIAIMNTPFFVSGYRWHYLARIWRTPILGELFQVLTNRWAFYLSVRPATPKLTKEQIYEMYSNLANHDTKITILRLYRAADEEKFARWEHPMLQTTAQVPTLVLWGAHDPYIPTWVADRFGARKVKHFAQCGHWLQVEEPEKVSEELLRFFDAAS